MKATTMFNDVKQRLEAAYPDWMLRHPTFATTDDGRLSPSYDGDYSARKEVEPQDALLYASKHSDGWSDYHRLVLDLDVPAVLIPSATAGNSHLVADVHIRKDRLDALLDALAHAGVIQHGYAESGKRSPLGTTIRLPWVKKGEDKTLTQLRAGDDPAEVEPF